MSAGRTSRRESVSAVLAVAVAVFALAAGDANAALVGLVRVAPNTASTSAAKSITATCPAGKRVIGAGADTSPGDGRVLIDSIRPDATLSSVTVHAGEDEAGTAASWYLQAFVICAPAPAGLELVTATSPANSINKSITATCPAGKRLLGNGAAITGAAGQVLLDGQLPNATPTAVTVNALEDETGAAVNWSVSAYAICSTVIAGLQRVAFAGTSNSDASRLVSAHCPAGKSVIGLGGTINSANGQVVLDAVFPDSGLTSASIAAFEDGTGNSANWSLTAYAICANSAQLVTATTGRQDTSVMNMSVQCPTGQAAAGVGADLSGGLGRVGIAGLRSTFLGVTAGTYPFSTVVSWSIEAQSICATPFSGQEVVSAEGPFASTQEPAKSVTATCPAGKRVIGAGGAIDLGLLTYHPEVVLEAVEPNATLTTVTATAHEEFGPTSAWEVDAYAVCAAPPPGLQRVAATSAPSSDEFSQVSASCPAGKHLIGTGGKTIGGAGQVLLDDLRADAALTKTTVLGVANSIALGSGWQVTAYAICINR